MRTIANMVRDDGILIVESKYVHDAINMKAIKQKISKNALAPSLPPTTLRIVTSATHKMEDIDTLLQSLGDAVDEIFANN